MSSEFGGVRSGQRRRVRTGRQMVLALITERVRTLVKCDNRFSHQPHQSH